MSLHRAVFSLCRKCQKQYLTSTYKILHGVPMGHCDECQADHMDQVAKAIVEVVKHDAEVVAAGNEAVGAIDRIQERVKRLNARLRGILKF